MNFLVYHIFRHKHHLIYAILYNLQSLSWSLSGPKPRTDVLFFLFGHLGASNALKCRPRKRDDFVPGFGQGVEQGSLWRTNGSVHFWEGVSLDLLWNEHNEIRRGALILHNLKIVEVSLFLGPLATVNSFELLVVRVLYRIRYRFLILVACKGDKAKFIFLSVFP